MLSPGAYTACVTPFDIAGKVDRAALAKALAWLEASGCRGAVLAGTNGEGPSLSAAEKRDLIEDSVPFAGQLSLLLGIATTSLEEAKWLCRRAGDAKACAVLVMPPFYYKVGQASLRDWFWELMDSSPIPVLVYNLPQMTGVTLETPLIADFMAHPNAAGLKDSSGHPENLSAFRVATPSDKLLFIGYETLLWQALEEGWSGTISGVANVLAPWIAQIVCEFFKGQKESAQAKFELILPLIQTLRNAPQPATNKAILKYMNILSHEKVRLPLTTISSESVFSIISLIEERLGSAGTCKNFHKTLLETSF